jgi:hypothetical protein
LNAEGFKDAEVMTNYDKWLESSGANQPQVVNIPQVISILDLFCISHA